LVEVGNKGCSTRCRRDPGAGRAAAGARDRAGA
jgi:hypothetical protein